MVDVVVDDKGTTKKMAVSQRQLDGAMKDTEKSTRQARKQIRGAAQTASAGGKQFAALASGTGGLVGAYATLAAQIFAVTAAFNFLKSAGSLKLLQEGQLAYTSAVGTSMKALTQDIQAATGAQLSFQEAAQAGAIATAAGLNPEQITALGKAAKDASTVLGRDLTDSFNRLVRGVTKAEPELLDELGIILRLEDAQQKYKDSLGITGELNAFQRSQAVTADVLGQVEEKYSKVLEVTGASENEFQKLATAFDDIINGLREFSVSFLTPIAQVLQEFPQLIIAAFAPFTIQILRAGLPSLASFSTALDKVAVSAKTSYTKAKTEQRAYFKDLEKLRASPKAQLILKKSVDDEMRANLKKVKLNKRSLLQKLRDGETLSKQQLAKIKQNLAKEVRGYKIKDATVLANLKKHLKQYELLNQASAGRVTTIWTRTGAAIGAATSAGVAVSKSALASLAAFGAKVGTFLAGALSVLSWIGIIAAIGGLIYAFVRGEKVIEKTVNKFQDLIDKEETLRGETEKFVATQNILNNTLERGTKAIEAYGNRLANMSSLSLDAMLNQQTLSIAFSGFATAIEEARLEVEKYEKELQILDDLAQQPAINVGGYGSMATAFVNANQTKKAQEGLEEQTKKSTANFFEFIAAQEDLDASTKSAIATLGREREEYKGMTNEALGLNKVTEAYIQILDEMAEGNNVDIADVLKKREAVIGLASTISALNRATEENIKKNTQLRFKQFPLTEIDAFIDALTTEEQQLRAIIKTQKDGVMLPGQEERLEQIKNARQFMANTANVEFQVNKANLAIQLAEAKLLAGKTKLIQADVKAHATIAKNRVQIFKSEQQILRGRNLIAEKTKELEETLKSGTEEQKIAARQELDILDARGRAISTEEQRVLVLRAQTAELERQLNTTQQLRDSALQAFETNLQSGIAGLIKGTKDFKDALVDLAKGVLNSIADTLSKQITTNIMKQITGAKDPAETMAEAIKDSAGMGALEIKTQLVEGAREGANLLASAVSGTPPGITPPVSGGGTGTGTGTSGSGATGATGAAGAAKEKVGFFERLFGKKEDKEANPNIGVVSTTNKGTPVVKNPGTTRVGGIFGPFLNDFSAIFEQNTVGGFLGQLGKTFMSGAEGFGSVFTDLLGGLFGGGGGGGLGGLLGGIFGFRYGGIASYRYGGMSRDRYSVGGIAKGPQSGYPAVLHGNEAIVPLPSGGKIPVEMKGGGGQTNNVGVTVNISGDGQATTEMQGDPGRSEALGKLVAGAVQEELQRQRRPGGILSPYGAAGGI